MGNNILLAGGGTGGHLLPGLAIAQAVTRLSSGRRLIFVVTSRQIDQHICSNWPFEIHQQSASPFSISPAGLYKFVTGLRSSVKHVRQIISDQQVGIIVALGGFGSAPAILAGKAAGLPVVMINPDAVPGRANRFMASRANKIYLQWQAAAEKLGLGDSKVEVTGCPVRQEIIQAAELKHTGGQKWRNFRKRAAKEFGFDTNRHTLFVTGASQGARNLNLAVGRLLMQLSRVADKWQILHQTGAGMKAQTESYYRRFCTMGYKLVEFCDRMDLALAMADLVICRAGAVTLAEVTAMGCPAVMLPYPYHRDRHQWHNAKILADAQGGIIVEDYKDNVERTSAQLYQAIMPLMEKDQIRDQYSRQCQQLGKLDAAQRIASWIVGQLDDDQ